MESKIKTLICLSLIFPFISMGQMASDTSILQKDLLTPKGENLLSVKPLEEAELSQAVESKSPTYEDGFVTTLVPVEEALEKTGASVEELHYILEKDLERINRELTALGLKYREERVLKIKQEETVNDLSFLNRLEGIKETIAYETIGNSENFIIAAERFLDTLFNENTDVSERFKDLSQERYDNYLAKDKIIKLQINDVKVERNTNANAPEKKYKYSGFAMLQNFSKRVRVEFYSDGFVRRADRKLMYEVAKEDDMEQVMTVEGVIKDFKHGRVSQNLNKENMPLSIIILDEWIIVDREFLIEDFKK